MAASTIKAGATVGNLWGDVIATIARASSPQEVREYVAHWAQDERHRQTLSDTLFAPMAQADMGGQLFVADIELGDRKGKKRLADTVDMEPFLRMPFADAIRFFRERFGDEKRLTEVIRAYRERADYAAKRTLQDLADRVVVELERSLTEGGAIDDFARSLADSAIGQPNQTSYLDNVFRTNIATAYGAGRLREIERSADVVPFVQYRTSGDSRVRPAHAELDGLIFRTSNPEWKRIAPPNSYRCRCVIVTLDEEDVAGRRVSEVTPQMLSGIDFKDPPTDLIKNPL